jgi:outer membrane protein OmpA-like peptidoglycan-associated protein
MPPAIAAYAGVVSPTAITGTWDEGNAQKLTIGIPAVKLSATLGTDKALTTDSKGNWALAIAQPLKPGVYDVTAVETAKDGRSASDNSTAEIYIKAPPPPPPPPAPPPAFDCGPPLAELQAPSPIQFAFDAADIRPPDAAAIGKIAALLNDLRCKAVKVHVAGRADFYGDRRYDIALSIRRAQAVVDALAAAGVDPVRLSVDGYGKDQPLGPDHSDAARSRNRSVIVSIVK